MSFEISFVTSNEHKFAEASHILGGAGVNTRMQNTKLQEIQADSITSVAKHKAHQAADVCLGPFFVKDDALEIESLGGFPGPYSSYVLATAGIAGVLRMLEGCGRRARFRAAVSYRLGGPGASLESLEASVGGFIPLAAHGDGWGYDPVFVPDGGDLTFAQLPDKDSVSHRGAALRMLAARIRSPNP